LDLFLQAHYNNSRYKLASLSANFWTELRVASPSILLQVFVFMWLVISELTEMFGHGVSLLCRCLYLSPFTEVVSLLRLLEQVVFLLCRCSYLSQSIESVSLLRLLGHAIFTMQMFISESVNRICLIIETWWRRSPWDWKCGKSCNNMRHVMRNLSDGIGQ